MSEKIAQAPKVSTYLKHRLIILSCGLMGIVFGLGYMLLHLSMDTTTEHYMFEEAIWVSENIPFGEPIPPQAGPRAFSWHRQALPPILQTLLRQSPNSLDTVLYQQTDSEMLYLLPFYIEQGQTLYVWHALPLEWDEESLFSVTERLLVLFFIAIAIALISAYWLGNTLTRPIKALANWAKQGHSQAPMDDVIERFAETQRLSQHLQKSLKQIEANNDNERLLIQSLSHEINTPLAIMRGAKDLLELKQGDALAPNKAWQKLVQAQHRMEQRVSSILSLWQPDAKQHRETLDLNTVMSTLCVEAAESPRIQITANSPLEVQASPVLAELLLGNLLNNALQYSGHTQVKVSIESKGIEIHNTKVSQAAGEGYGFGVGLMLSQKICARHDWQLSITDGDKDFTVRLNTQVNQD